MKPDMLTYVMDSLNAEGTNLAEVVRQTKLKESWMRKLKYGAIPDPGVRKIQRLADYFKKQARKK